MLAPSVTCVFASKHSPAYTTPVLTAAACLPPFPASTHTHTRACSYAPRPGLRASSVHSFSKCQRLDVLLYSEGAKVRKARSLHLVGFVQRAFHAAFCVLGQVVQCRDQNKTASIAKNVTSMRYWMPSRW